MANNCSVKFNGNVKVDLIKISKDISLSFQDAKLQKSHIDSNMVLFCDFIKNSTNAYYLSPENNAHSTVFSIYKKTPNQKYYDYVCQLKDGNCVFYDYNIKNGQYYHYLACAELKIDNDVYEYQIYESSTSEGPEYYRVHFDGWSICNIEETEDEYVYMKTGDMWTLGLNLEDQTITQGLSITQWDTLGRYSRVSVGQKNCETGTFSGLLGLMSEYKEYNILKTDKEQEILDKTKYSEVYRYTEKKEYYNAITQKWEINGPNHEYSTEMDKLAAWKQFCSDGELKLLRDIKGNAWIVQIVDQPNYNIESGKYTRISFTWQEVKDIDSCSIIVAGSM